MALPVETSMTLGWCAAAGPRRNTRLTSDRFDPLAKGITIVTFVSDDPFLCRQNDLFGGNSVVSVARRERQLNGTATAVDQGCNFGVQATFSAAKPLILLASGGVRGVLMNFDVRGIQMS